jgi:hypothetical protein
MKRLHSCRKLVAMVLIVTFVLRTVTPAIAATPVSLRDFDGAIDFRAEGPTPFVLSGTASRLGQYRCYGEVEFYPGKTRGTLVGEGVAVFQAENGDLLTAVVSWDVAADGRDYRTSELRFSWRDAIEFNDGTFVPTTGGFEDDKPTELVVIAIIAVLIGLLLPAVQ